MYSEATVISLHVYVLCRAFLQLISVDKCKFMDSKMRPLWLVFHNDDELGDLVRIIFKNGDGKTPDLTFTRIYWGKRPF